MPDEKDTPLLADGVKGVPAAHFLCGGEFLNKHYLPAENLRWYDGDADRTYVCRTTNEPASLSRRTSANTVCLSTTFSSA